MLELTRYVSWLQRGRHLKELLLLLLKSKFLALPPLVLLLPLPLLLQDLLLHPVLLQNLLLLLVLAELLLDLLVVLELLLELELLLVLLQKELLVLLLRRATPPAAGCAGLVHSRCP